MTVFRVIALLFLGVFFLPGACLAEPMSSGVKQRSPVRFSGDGYSVEQFDELTQAGDGYRAFLAPVFLAEGSIKELSLETSLGLVQVLTQDGVERLYSGPGRDNAVLEAVSKAHEAMQKVGFPARVIEHAFPWRMVLLRDIPRPLSNRMLSSSRCHAAWMGPPATIVVAVNRLTPRCYGQMRGGSSHSGYSQRDAFVGILLHEIGHAIEFRLMGKAFGRRQRWHSEGFAQWFEQKVREVLLDDPKLFELKRAEAKDVFNSAWRPELFHGSRDDYLQSFALVASIAEFYGLQSLLSVYETMDLNTCSFSEAVSKRFGWDLQSWSEESFNFLSRKQSSR